MNLRTFLLQLPFGLLALSTGCVTSKDGVPESKWSRIRSAVESGSYRKAAGLTLKEVESTRYPDKSFTVWKWFESELGTQSNYLDMQRSMAEALVDEFKTGSVEERRLIAAIFKYPGAENLPYETFRAQIFR